jgi:hypothetical protein
MLYNNASRSVVLKTGCLNYCVYFAKKKYFIYFFLMEKVVGEVQASKLNLGGYEDLAN